MYSMYSTSVYILIIYTYRCMQNNDVYLDILKRHNSTLENQFKHFDIITNISLVSN